FHRALRRGDRLCCRAFDRSGGRRRRSTRFRERLLRDRRADQRELLPLPRCPGAPGHRFRHPIPASPPRGVQPPLRGSDPRRGGRPAVGGRVSEQVFLLPDLGEGLTDADIISWLIDVGDTVAVDQPIVEVETAKTTLEVPSPYAGTVTRLHVKAGETLAVGKPLLTVTATPEHAAAEQYREEERAGSGSVLVGFGTADTRVGRRRRRPRSPAPALPPRAAPLVISPIVRRFAREHGVDLTGITPTGAGGAITRRDVESAIAPAAARGERRRPLTSFRKAAAAALSRSRSEIPEATVWVDVDATALWELRESTRESGGPGLISYIARFVVAALGAYPVLNSRPDTQREEIGEHEHINLGIAVQGERGLVVPAVTDAHSLTTAELHEAIREVSERARAGQVSGEELERGTFTLNNYGVFRVDGSAAIINHPQVAILGLGRIIDRPWVVQGEIVPRKIAQMSVVFDHRVCDGATAAGFMRHVADAIENPATAIAQM